MQTIEITTGRFEGQTLEVTDNEGSIIRANLPEGGTICLPKNSQTTHITYFTEVDNARPN